MMTTFCYNDMSVIVHFVTFGSCIQRIVNVLPYAKIFQVNFTLNYIGMQRYLHWKCQIVFLACFMHAFQYNKYCQDVKLNTFTKKFPPFLRAEYFSTMSN